MQKQIYFDVSCNIGGDWDFQQRVLFITASTLHVHNQLLREIMECSGRPQSISDSAESESSEDAEIGVPTLELSFATATSITLCSPRVFKTLISSLFK